MARYRVHVFCDSCSQTHPMHITVNLDDGPVDEASIGDAYNGKKLSATVAALTKNQVQCPKTKKMVCATRQSPDFSCADCELSLAASGQPSVHHRLVAVVYLISSK